MNKKIKMFTLFSGYDSQMMGLIDAARTLRIALVLNLLVGVT